MIAHKTLLAAFPLILSAIPALAQPLNNEVEKRDLPGTSPLTKRGGWTGLKAYAYSPSCGADGNTDGSTWQTDQIHTGNCYTFNGNQDMWSIEYGSGDDLKQHMDGGACADPYMGLYLEIYHGCYDCNCGVQPDERAVGADGGCINIEKSMKSFFVNCRY